MNWSVEERRNFRRVVLAVSLVGLAAFGRAAHSQESANEAAGLAVSIGYTGDLRFELAYEKSWPMFAQRTAPRDPSVARTGE